MNRKEILQDGLDRLRTKWPQSHIVDHDSGHALVTVPSVLLPPGYKQTICTVLFVAPPGFPASHPENFWTDIDIDLAQQRTEEHTTYSWFGPDEMETWPTTEPQKTAKFSPGQGYLHPVDGKWRSAESRFTFERLWPQWRTAMIWGLRLQAWNPNHSGLYTYMSCIRQRLFWTPRYAA